MGLISVTVSSASMNDWIGARNESDFLIFVCEGMMSPPYLFFIIVEPLEFLLICSPFWQKISTGKNENSKVKQ